MRRAGQLETQLVGRIDQSLKSYPHGRNPISADNSDFTLGKSMQEKANTPVTVLMPVRNGAEWIAGALESINAQDYNNFEVLLVDDQSTDNSVHIASEIFGEKLRIIKAGGQGLAKALALGVLASDTEYITRLDVDDRSHRTRISRQVTFLNQNPTHVLVGSNVNLTDKAGVQVGRSHFPLSDSAIRLRMILGNPFAHSAVTFLRSAVLSAGNYWSPNAHPFPEDYHLWSRLASLGQFANLDERLVDYRVHSTGISYANRSLMRSHSSEISWDWLSTMGLTTPAGVSLKEAWFACYGEASPLSVKQAYLVMQTLLRARKNNPQDFNSRAIRLKHYLTPISRMYSGQ